MLAQGEITMARRPVALGAVRSPCWSLVAAALALLGPPAPATATELDLGVPDLELRLDTTLRYNLGLRTDGVSRRLGDNPAFTAGENSVSQGDLTTNRLDVLAELDASWRRRFGVRASAAGWYDQAYVHDRATRSPRVVAQGIPGSYLDDEFTRVVRRRYHGPWGELLDAFAFAQLRAGSVPVAVKAGRHTVYWGESLMQAGLTHSVAYAQMPLDLQKAFANPGAEPKELFRPLASVSAQAQLAPTLSLAAQVFLEWQPFLYPEGGTFLGASDATYDGPDGLYRNGAYMVNGGVNWPRQAGDVGAVLRWAPAWLDGTLGLYYRRFTDKFAAVLLTANPGAQGPLSPEYPSPFRYQQYYGADVDLVGVSLAKQVLGVSVGAEASWRHRMPLLAQSPGFAVAPAPPLQAAMFPHGLPRKIGSSYQARGDTLHGLVNLLGVVPGGRAFSSAAWGLELTFSRRLAVTDNEDLFYGEGYGVCRPDPALVQAGLARTRDDGCATRGHLGLGASLTPTWFRVASGADLYVPVTLSWTVVGNSPVGQGGNQASGSWTAGAGLDLRSRYRVELRYADWFGKTNGGATITTANGLPALLKSRGNVTLTAKTTF